MPRLARWAVRTALIHLLLGAAAGALYWANTQWALWPPLAALNPVVIHLLVVGWATQLIYGVIYWMFPILSKENLRGDDRLAWAAWGLLNAGLLLRVVFEPWRSLDPQPFNGVLLTLSALLQVLAGWLIVIVCWPRVRERPGR
jgi:hypothetical protein